MKPILGRISMCFLISGHTSKVSFKAVLALLVGESVVRLAKPWQPIPTFFYVKLLFVSIIIIKMEHCLFT